MSRPISPTELRKFVENAIDKYEYHLPPSAIGQPWSPERVQVALEEFRASLVEPYWISVEVRDSLEDIHRDPPLCRDCMVVATDQAGMILAFDLEARGFVLITRSSSGGYETFGVRGDAVGCFLSR